jgi:hypothetical protein
MKERPILMSAPMVRALLAGKKTQTRRIVKPQPELGEHGWEWPSAKCKSMVEVREMGGLGPYGGRGDRLWVRETWNAIHAHHDGEIDVAQQIPKARGTWSAVYAATDSQRDEHRDDRGFGWRPGIHMPRWASRITLDVTSVRVERLHAITEADAWAEGIDEIDGMLDAAAICAAAKLADCGYEDARATFAALWCEINGAESWEANPWVWVVGFKRVEAIDG